MTQKRAEEATRFVASAVFAEFLWRLGKYKVAHREALGTLGQNPILLAGQMVKPELTLESSFRIPNVTNIDTSVDLRTPQLATLYSAPATQSLAEGVNKAVLAHGPNASLVSWRLPEITPGHDAVSVYEEGFGTGIRVVGMWSPDSTTMTFTVGIVFGVGGKDAATN